MFGFSECERHYRVSISFVRTTRWDSFQIRLFTACLISTVVTIHWHCSRRYNKESVEMGCWTSHWWYTSTRIRLHGASKSLNLWTMALRWLSIETHIQYSDKDNGGRLRRIGNRSSYRFIERWKRLWTFWCFCDWHRERRAEWPWFCPLRGFDRYRLIFRGANNGNSNPIEQSRFCLHHHGHFVQIV